MKKIITLLLILGIPFLASAKKKYYITNAEIIATIQKNGLVHFEETRTYEFDGRFKWVSFELPKMGFDKLQNVQIWEGNNPYLLSDSEDPNTFEIKEKSNRYLIKWYIKADDETRSFTVTYDLEGALVSDTKWSEFYWVYLSDNWDKQNENVSIKLQFEENTDVRYWVYSSRTTNESIQQLQNGWQYSAQTSSKHHQVKIQTQFPTEYLNHVSSVSGAVNPESADDVYQGYQLELEKNAEQALVIEAWGWKFYFPILILPFYFFYRFYSRNKPQSARLEKGDSKLPETIHPAIVTYLMNYRTISGGALKATLMKFVFDGVIKLEYEGRVKKMVEDRPLIKISFTDVKEEDLSHEFERDFYRFLKTRAEKYEYLDDIFKKNGTKVSKWLTKWLKLVEKEAKTQPWYVEESKSDMHKNIGVQIVLVLVGGLITFAVGPLGIFAIGIPFILMVLSGTIYHRNEEGEALYKKMDSAKKAIKSLRKSKGEVSKTANWPLFIWALALGNTKADVNYLIKQWPIDSIPNISFASALQAVDLAFVLDDLVAITHGAYMGNAGAAGASGAASGVAGGGAGGGAG